MTTAQERLDWLLETEFVPTGTLVTIGMIRDEIGLTTEQYALVRGTLETAVATLRADPDTAKQMAGIDLADALAAMLSRGMSFSNASRQGTIDLLAQFGQWPDFIRDKIKELGGRTQPRWVREGYEAEPTLEHIQKDAIIADARQQLSNAIGAINEQYATLSTIDIDEYTPEELQAFVDSLLGGE
jgi:hypothetical protein